MLSSQLFLPTLKESPADAELVSHKLMIRAGLIRKLASGLYTWLPLGLKILRKVEAIVREEMVKAGAQEILMPTIQPAELWKETGRWGQYGPMLLKMLDRHERPFCYGPTHEEVITALIRNEVNSYKQLPLNLFQIQTKFRDEIRPRFGLMRAREFLMKDGYSFDLDETGMRESYNKMHASYTAIFTRLGFDFRCVLADSGEIGGSQSEEFHVLAHSGEDVIAYSTESSYAANIERATAGRNTHSRSQPSQPFATKTTPGIIAVSDQAAHMGLPITKILKTLLVKGAHEDHPVVALIVRGDHKLNDLKAQKLQAVYSPLTLISEEEVLRVAQCKPGFVGPIGLSIPIYADLSIEHLADFSCGANKNDEHFVGVNWERDCSVPQFVDLRCVVEGDISPDGKGTLQFARGIEVGHIFQLGTQYSEAMNAVVLNKEGKSQPLFMGCYGIGVSRILAAAIEQCHDEKGIVWPKILAPFDVAIVPIGYHKDAVVKETTDKLYQELIDKGLDVLLEDRNERPGVMFSTLDLIGIPTRIVVGSQGLANGEIEIKHRREKTAVMIKLDQLVTPFPY